MNHERGPGKTFTRRTLLANSSLIVAGGILLPSALRGQSTAPAAPPPITPQGATADYPQPAKNPYPYSGVSGTGFPVTEASVHGGYRSGSSGLAYQ
jgi:hypothetical protein